MPEGQKEHPLEEYSENEQVAYLSILSAICYADKEFGDKEKHQLDNLLAQLKISDVGKAKIYSSVFSLPHEDKLANLEAIQNLGDTELKYTLISDLCLFSLVDATFTDEEYQYILGIGELFGISQEQVDAIKSTQEDLDRIKDIPSNSERCQITPVNVPAVYTHYDPPIYVQSVPPIFSQCFHCHDTSSANREINKTLPVNILG